jgi:hypothetical protein
VDGNEATAWVFKPSSKKRKLTIRLNIKDKIQTIQILACQKLRNGPAYFIPLRLLEVKINHKNTFPVIMESGASSGILRLDEAMRIYHVEVRVLTMGAKPEEMTDSPGLAGISEIYFYSLD